MATARSLIPIARRGPGRSPVRALFWVISRTIGPRQLRKVLAERRLPAGGPTLKETISKPGGGAAEAVERLRDVVERFQAHPGPLQPSPMFGPMDRETLTQLHLIHGAHHLSFLIPAEQPGAAAERPTIAGGAAFAGGLAPPCPFPWPLPERGRSSSAGTSTP